MALKDWVRLPSTWINRRGLRRLQWGESGLGSDNTAALMALTVIAHHADRDNGAARITYDMFCTAAGLSRAKLSNGLGVLENIRVIERAPNGRSTYRLAEYDPNGGWAKLPARAMYVGDRIAGFANFGLRSRAELDALKLFFLFAARRDRDTNMANISYDKIEEYTGIQRPKIKPALSLLTLNSFIRVETVESTENANGVANVYRVVGVEPYRHNGTTGRRGLA